MEDMKFEDIIKQINNIEIDEEFTNKVEQVYSCELSDFVKRLLSIPETIDYEEKEISLFKMSNDFILEANEELQCDFISKHLIPIFDCYENDYLCYDFLNNIYVVYNVFEELTFDRNDDILKLSVLGGN